MKGCGEQKSAKEQRGYGHQGRVKGTDRQTDRQTDKETDRRKDRHTGKLGLCGWGSLVVK